MHGVQPIAKIAPSPNDASQPPRVPTIRPPSRSANLASVPPVAAGRRERDRARRGRDGTGGARLERPPGSIERGDAQHAGEIQPEDDEQDPAELAEDRQVVDQWPRERTWRSRRGA